MLRIGVYGIGAVAICYLVAVTGVLMSWRRRALAQGRLADDFDDSLT